MKRFAILFIVCAAVSTSMQAADTKVQSSREALFAPLEKVYPDLDALYLDLHQTPELSHHEVKTAVKMAERLQRLGFTVTSNVGGNGVVGVLANGKGPTVLVRTDIDGLPVEEKTGLPYASTAKSADGLPVMHACGHDLHMTGWAGAAELLAKSKSSWRGTLVFIAQPAEEKGAGAASMLSDGLFTRFPKPDFAIAFHASAELPAGQAGVAAGYVTAYVDSVDVRIFGKGGHGAYPHMTVDPIVIAARTVLALQTLISREKNPLEPGVITVGAFHSGTKHNVISDEAHMQITVRSYKDDVQKQLVSGIERIAKAEALAAGAPREPSVVLDESTLPSTFNDPALAKRVKASLVSTLGEANVTEPAPVMAGEDFAEYGRAGVPAVLFWVGTVEEGKFRKAKGEGAALPSLHSSSFAPDRKPSIQTAARSLAGVVFDLLGRP